MSGLTVPNQMLPDKSLPGVGADGKTIKTIHIKDEFAYSYLILVFFRIGTKEDAEEVLKFSDHLKDFDEAGCKILGVTSESPLSVIRFMEKDVESGGYNRKLGFPIVSDKDLSLSMELGVAKKSGLPSWSTLIVDSSSKLRFSAIHRVFIKTNIPEILRLVSAYKLVDANEVNTDPTWKPGNEDSLIPRDFQAKQLWYGKHYGETNSDSMPKEQVKTAQEQGGIDNVKAV